MTINRPDEEIEGQDAFTVDERELIDGKAGTTDPNSAHSKVCVSHLLTNHS